MKRVAVIVLAVFLLLLSACNNNAIQQTPPPDGTELSGNEDLGVNDMGEQLLTVNEFLQLVAEYEKELGVTVADFDDVDVVDFIIVQGMSERVLKSFTEERRGWLAQYLKNYKSAVAAGDIDAYRPTELVIVESTDEEYERFLSEYLDCLGGRQVPSSIPQRQVVIRGDERIEFELYKTMDIEQLRAEGWEFSETGGLSFPSGTEDMRIGVSYFLSKNGKFFIIFYGDLTEDIVKTFCELED